MLERMLPLQVFFPMGIDKPDIRLVIHAGVPDSVEAYFQEIGRAGRDGLPARCLMVLLPGADVKRREFLLKDNPDRLAHERFRQMRSWVWLTDQCRRSWLLRYFGDPPHSREADCCSFCHPLDLGDTAALEAAESSRDRKRKAAARTAAESPSSRGPAPARRLDEAMAQLLFEELRQWRADKAQAAEVPPYVIFGDRDLMGIALAAPGSLDELAACRGVGPHKLATHGTAILGIVAPFLARLGDQVPRGPAPAPGEAVRAGGQPGTKSPSAPAASPPDAPAWDSDDGWPDEADNPPAAAASAAARSPRRTRETAGEKAKPSRGELMRQAASLLAAGTTVEAITLQLDRSTATVLDYLAAWVAAAPDDSWKPIPRRFLGREGYQAISAAFAAAGYREGPLKPIHETLGGQYDWDQLRLARAVWCHRDQRGPRLPLAATDPADQAAQP